MGKLHAIDKQVSKGLKFFYPNRNFLLLYKKVHKTAKLRLVLSILHLASW